MRRLGRWMLNALTVMSLLLCVATVALWVRSHRVADTYWRAGPWWVAHVGSSSGWLFVDAGHGPIRTLPPAGYKAQAPVSDVRRHPLPREPGIRHYGDIGVAAWFVTDGGTINAFAFPGVPSLPGTIPGSATFYPRRDFSVRHWFLAAICAALPVTRVLAWNRRRRPRRGGLCPSCGYDLRATPDRCPECGRETGAAEAKLPN